MTAQSGANMASGELDLSIEKNRQLLNEAIKNFDARLGPRVGDYIVMLDGSLRRFTYDWGDGLQTTVSNQSPAYDSSFYMGRGGFAEFSGSLDPSIPKERIIYARARRLARFWMFNMGVPGAGCGRAYEIKVKIWKEIDGTE